MAEPKEETILDEAKDLLVKGRRCMAVEDYQKATDYLEHSCQLFDAYYGVAKRECADAYLEYGLALVALANLEAGTGTDKLMKKAGIEDEEEEDGDDEEEDDDEEREDDDDDETADDDDEEAEENKKPEDESKPDAHTEEKETNGVVAMESSQEEPAKINGITNGAGTSQPQASASTSTASEPQPGTSTSATGGDDQDKDEDTENEEATTIEIAWEVLCLAKRLYMTDESLEGRLKLAETLQKIGEISIEWDNNDNAVSILEECLKIRSAILPPEDRLIALTYYHLGLAHSFKSDAENANDNFQRAINVIEKRIATLTEDLEKAKTEQDTVTVGVYQKEINELKELLPDMTMRIDDSKEDSVQSTEVMKRTREEMQLEDDEAKKVCLDKTKPVDDISHLVKRKAA